MTDRNRIDVKDIHQTFWRCRDFELSNLWQRSIFLTAFLVICFTAYGTVLLKLFDQEVTNEYILIGLNITEYALTVLGLIFSILWVKMGKGSKAWYEVYESAIGALETNQEYATAPVTRIGGFTYASLEGYRGVKINNSLFSTRAGEYSVSKLNIAIGQVFMVLWSILSIIHISAIGMLLHSKQGTGYLDIIAVGVGLVVFGFILYFFGHKESFESDSINSFKKASKMRDSSS